MKKQSFPLFEKYTPKEHYDWYDKDAKQELELALSKAYEQGKLDLLNRMYENGYISESTRDFYIEQEILKSIEQKRLKSQIKEAKP